MLTRRLLTMATTATVASQFYRTAAFQPAPASTLTVVPRMAINNDANNHSSSHQLNLSIPSPRRRHMSLMAGGFFSGLFGDDDSGGNAAYAATNNAKVVNSGKGPTNEVVKTVNGMRQRRLGGSDILVSELGLGTQRW